MASGSFYLNKGTGNANWKSLQGRIDWSSKSNGSVANTSTVTTKLYVRTWTGGTSERNWPGSVKVGNNTAHTFSDMGVDWANKWIGDTYVLFKTYTDTVTHNDDGTCSITISGSITGPNGTSLAGVTSSGSERVTLDTIPRYAKASISLVRKTETGITINWSSDSTIDHIWYSVSDGSTWIDKGEAGGTSGSFTIGSLKPNTLYYVKVKVRRADSQLESSSSRLEVTTYDYPYCNSAPGFTIENTLTLGIENPLSRTCQVALVGNDGTSYGAYETNGTSIVGFNDTGIVNWLYSTISNLKQGTYQVKVTHQGNVRTTNGNTYAINTSKCFPTFSNYTYRDSNTAITDITGNNQVLIKGKSNLEVTISSANKMVTKNGATPSKYNLLIDSLNNNVNYSDSDIVVNMGSVINAGTKRLSVTAYDSRTLSHTVNKDVVVYDYNKPVINVDVSRLNNFESQTTLKISGSYDVLNIDGANKNSIVSVSYRYKEKEGEWTDWITANATVVNDKFTCNDVILNLDNAEEFNIEARVVDKLDQGIASGSIDVGEAIFFISSNKKACYINGEIVKGSTVVSSTQPTEGEEIWLQKSKNLFNKNINTSMAYSVSPSVLDTGIRVITNLVANNCYLTYKLNDSLLGKTITLTSNINASSSNQGMVRIYFGNSSNNAVTNIANLETSGSITVTIPSSFPNDTDSIYLLLYGNRGGTGFSVGAYVDYTNLQIEYGSTSSEYTPHLTNSKIFTKTCNGEYEAFNNTFDEYTLNEQKIGTFLGKPLYRKVISVGNLPNATTKTVSTNLTNVLIKKIEGYCRNNDNWTLPLPYRDVGNSTNDITILTNHENTILVITGSDRTDFSGYVVLEYTKTTD